MPFCNFECFLQTLIQRVQEQCHHHKSPEEMKQHFDEFNKIRSIFASKAGVKEISIDTEGKSPDNVAEEILGIISHHVS